MAARPSVATAAFGIGYAGFVETVALWWTGGRPLSSAASGLVDYGRLSGLLAAYLVLVQLTLRARIPWLEHGVETHRLARWHRYGGECLVVLAMTHALLILWGYAALSRHPLTTQAKALVLSYPDVLMATVALALLLIVGLISTRAIRRRVSYETWFHLHTYVYLATAIAISHQLVNGERFAANPTARRCWLGLYAVVATVLLWYRVLTPLRRLWRHQLRVVSVSEPTADTTSVALAGRELDRLGAKSGQFFRWRFLTRAQWWSANPYSLSAPPTGDRLRITAKAVGDNSGRLRELRPGTRVIAEGPYGGLSAPRVPRAGALLIAGGVGITPLRALLETVPAEPGQLTLIYRARSEADVLFANELDAIAAARGAEIHYLLGRSADLGHPLSAAALRKLVPNITERDVYLCGPAGMSAGVERALHELGVPDSQVHVEMFTLHTA